LRQSNVITVVSDGTIRAALGRMRRPAGTPLVSDVARELAQREGFRAVVEGEFQAVGNGYLLTLRLVSAEGDQLAAFPGTASLDELLPTVGQLTRRLRRRIGESLEHVRSSPPLPRVTSHSMAALRKYGEGTRALGANNHVLAVQLLNEAVALDSTFAMAWIVLSSTYRNANYPQDRSQHALERAYRHRERLPQRERYQVEASYFRTGLSRNRARALQAYEQGLQNDTAAFANSLGLLHQSRRNYARAESLFRWYSDRGINLQVAYENLSNALYFQGKRVEAESVEAAAASLFPNPQRWGRAAWYLYNRGQMDSAQLMLERQRAEGDPTQRRFAWWKLSELQLVRGRLAEAERARDQAGETNLTRGVSRDSVGERLWLASLDIWHRDQRERGLGRLERVLAETPLSSLPLVSPLQFEPYYLSLARAFAQAARPDRARQLLAQFQADNRDTTLKRLSEPAVHAVLGEIALAEGRAREALLEFRRADQLPDGPIDLTALGLHADVGRAFDQARMVDSAIATFEQYLETPQLDRFRYDAMYLPHILVRLGALYEEEGDRARAIGYYERFVNLWRNADPELQPRVAEARRRIESLRRANGCDTHEERRI
jgi:tetratricopeptide (TPR) repeat protein